MKKIVFPLLLLAAYTGFAQGTYNPQKAGAVAAYNAPLATMGVPLDARAYYYDTVKKVLRPYAGTGEVLARFDTASRKGHFGIVINTGGALSTTTGLISGGNNEEWWFKNGIADSNLVQKTNNGTAVGAMVYADDVFAAPTPLAIPSIKDSTLYNIISNNTGEVVTYLKIAKFPNGQFLTDANVDGVLIRKYKGNYYMLTKDRLTAKDFGARGDGITNDQLALQKAVDVCTSWGKTLYITAGQYIDSGKLNIPNICNVPTSVSGGLWFALKIIGDGKNATELKFVGTDPICIQAIDAEGGQGSGGGIYDIAISGNPTSSIGLYIAGRTGFSTYNCEFWNHKIAVKLEDRAGRSEATELSVMNNAFFWNCATFLEYDGNSDQPGSTNSFHGSGIMGGYGSIPTGSSYAVRVNGEAHPYNAPLSMHVWLSNSEDNLIKTIILNQTRYNNNNFYGNLNFESQNVLPATDSTHFTLANSLIPGCTQVAYNGSINGTEIGRGNAMRSGIMVISNAVEDIGYGETNSTNDFKFNASSLKVNNLAGGNTRPLGALADGTLTTIPNAIIIPGGANLDTVISAGKYVQWDDNLASLALNYPENASGTLTVSGADAPISWVQGKRFQMYQTRTNHIYVRSMSGGVWTAWTLPTALPPSNQTAEAGNVDLNTLTSAGKYVQWDDNLTSLALNYPENVSGVLTVSGTDAPTSWVQGKRFQMYQTRTNHIYIRSLVGSWGNWVMIFANANGGTITTAQPSTNGSGATMLGKVITGSDGKKYWETNVDGVTYYIPALTALP